MYKRLFLSIICLVLLSIRPGFTQNRRKTEQILQQIADSILQETEFNFLDEASGKVYSDPAKVPAGAQLKLNSRYTDWRYWNGIINMAMGRLGRKLNNSKYSKYPIDNIAFDFDNYKYFEENYQNEGKWSYPLGQLFIMEELDDCGAMGASVIEVYKQDLQARYRAYIDKAAAHIMKKQDRLKDGTWARSFPHKWTVWADDLYMGISFLARMGELTGASKYFDEAAKQVINFHKYLFDENKGLMHHNWYSDVEQQGVAFWGRANGWALLAQVELLDHLPEEHPQQARLINLLKKHILGVARYQDREGLWHQLLDKANSYQESSCSAMFVYIVARAVNNNYIKPRYMSIARQGWKGLLTKIGPDGKVKGVCTGTVVSDNLVDYYNRPAPLNDVHGIGVVLLAGIEMLETQE